ncbi:SDR family NAD(P)-dependent oxidoreductase [Rhodococcus jostii]|uniref:NAD(P)-dependent dehydrogenase, short-chain alcohol dehydrogenase family n=1 Tax=Rhodococcus jostii TaxID=132919 RepID=A0A1H4TGN3_RHOJO|nr:SDR family NAD(P)-dependent oxidoreductase [Rhodococcus jostii]SEC55636.1 NAD(P)-dependent dehydrogenase, short-chain alcohol dehydrogenase family [Rhodococcus jostii]
MTAAIRGLADKNVLITGAARGVGHSCAIAFAHAGANVAALDVPGPMEGLYPLSTSAMLTETVDSIVAIGRQGVALSCDLRDEAEVQRAVDHALDAFDGRIDVIVNNAGLVALDAIHEMRSDVMHALIDTMVKGPIYVAKYAIPNMIGRRSGKIINISSATTRTGMAMVSHYVAAKHAVNGLTSAWAYELAEFGINVNAVAPASLRSGPDHDSAMVSGIAQQIGITAEAAFEQFSENGNFPGPKWRVEADHIRDTVLFLASDNADQITGQVVFVDGGQSAR